jgi:hypothetical protein
VALVLVHAPFDDEPMRGVEQVPAPVFQRIAARTARATPGRGCRGSEAFVCQGHGTGQR